MNNNDKLTGFAGTSKASESQLIPVQDLSQHLIELLIEKHGKRIFTAPKEFGLKLNQSTLSRLRSNQFGVKSVRTICEFLGIEMPTLYFAFAK